MKYIRSSGCLADDCVKIVNSMLEYMRPQEYTFNDCTCTFLPHNGLIIMCNDYTKKNLKSIAQVLDQMLEKLIEPLPYYSAISRNFTIVEVDPVTSIFMQCRQFIISNLYENCYPHTRFTWTLITHHESYLFKIPELETYTDWARPLLAISSIIYDNVLFKLTDGDELLSYPMYLDYAPVYDSCRITPNVGLHYDIAGITCEYLKQTSDISTVVNFIRWEDVIDPSDIDIAGLPIYEYCIVLDCIAKCVPIDTPRNIYTDKSAYRIEQCAHQFNIATVLNTAMINENGNKLKPHSKKAVLEHLHKSTFDKSLTDTSHNCLSYNDKYGCLVHEILNKQDVYLFSHSGEEIEFLPYLKKDLDEFIKAEVKRVAKLRSTAKDHIKIVPQESVHVLISLPYYISSLAKGVDPILKYKIENKCLIDVYMTFSPRRVIDATTNALVLRVNKWSLSDETSIQTDIDTILPTLTPSIIWNNRNRNLYLLAEPL